MRYHTAKDIMDVSEDGYEDESLFHNILVNPSMTPWYGNNPGISVMEINDEDLIPYNYHASYLNLGPTVGKKEKTPYEQLEWRDLDYEAEYGLMNLTAEGIHDLRVRLQMDPLLQHSFMIRKMGLDPKIHEERQRAF